MRLIFLFSVASLCAALATNAQERILSYKSDIEVLLSREVQVTETIKVHAEGNQIRRGIFREFPVIYKDERGRIKVPFNVLEVTRDGQPEPYHTASSGDYEAVYIGDSDVFLEPGDYEYTITYTTNRMLGFHEDVDELYWNVTGNNWGFSIESAAATVQLPPGATILQTACYAGYFGSSDTADCDVELTKENVARFQLRRTLQPNEGLTIAVGFTKGIVPPPSEEELESYYISDKKATRVALAGFAIIFLYYLFAWFRVGKDPAGGSIVPRFTPPEGFSPAASRYVMRMGFDNKIFTASIVSMAVKGYLKIDEYKKRKFKLIKTGKDTSQLTAGEKKIASKLFAGSDEITLKQSNHSKISGAIDKLKKELSGEFEKVHFKKNFWWFFPGVLLSILLIVLIVYYISVDEEKTVVLIVGGIMLTFASLYLYQLYRAIAHIRTQGVMKAIGLLLPLLIFGVIAYTVGTQVIAHQGLDWHQVDYYVPWKIFLVIIGLIFLAILFYDLMKAPTVFGRKQMDLIEGLKMYMGVAEKHRLERMHEPKKTPALFEALLPYAIALDVENSWAEKFDDVLKKVTQEAGSGGYAPPWYTTRSGTFRGTRHITSSLGSSLSSAVSSSSTAPGSSSGSGGGGFSGGGGGGGGGGGW